MNPVWVLAHGALGGLDEVLYVAVFVIFVALLIAPSLLTMLRKRGEDEESAGDDALTEAASTPQADKPDHFRLD